MSLHTATSPSPGQQERDARWKALISAKDAQILEKDTRIIDLEDENARLSEQLSKCRTELPTFQRPQRNFASGFDSEELGVSGHEDKLEETSATKKRKLLHSASLDHVDSKRKKPVLVTNSGSSPKSLSRLARVRASSKLTSFHLPRAYLLTLVPTDEKFSFGITTNPGPQQLHVSSIERKLLPGSTLLPASERGFPKSLTFGWPSVPPSDPLTVGTSKSGPLPNATPRAASNEANRGLFTHLSGPPRIPADESPSTSAASSATDTKDDEEMVNENDQPASASSTANVESRKLSPAPPDSTPASSGNQREVVASPETQAYDPTKISSWSTSTDPDEQAIWELTREVTAENAVERLKRLNEPFKRLKAKRERQEQEQRDA